MDTRLMESFVAVAEELHLDRAAKRLNISQPPLSKRIQQLERIIGAALLRRTNRRVEITDAGLVFLTATHLPIRVAA
jgi:DNA-binding transcriptional LysR family regulator